MKIVIIGGGAGGVGAAARSRRLSEEAEITLFERSNYVSYSNCGLPYKFSKAVKNFEDLIINTPEVLKNRYNIDVHVKHEVTSLDVDKKVIKVINLISNEELVVSYDKLIIAAGVSAICPPIPGVKEAKNIFSLKTPDDVEAVESFIENNKVKNIIVIGGGFIGAEIAENFAHNQNYNVSIIDTSCRLLPHNLDYDFSAYIHKAAIENGINLILSETVSEISDNGKTIKLKSGNQVKADLIFMTVGVRVENAIYKNSGLKFGATKGIIVNNKQETNIQDVYAIGDIAESFDIYGNHARITLAAPASRQATVVANTIFNYVNHNKQPDVYIGSQGTSTLTMFDTTVASVGKTEEQLKKEGISYNKTINARPSKISSVQGGGQNIFLKVLYDDQYRILGAQSAGAATAEKRISYIAFGMLNGITYDKYEDFQIAYAPTVDTTFDVTNMGARIAKHQFDGTLKSIFPEMVKDKINSGAIIIDVRTKLEWRSGHIEGSINIPLGELRGRISELNKDQEYIVHCKTGARSYNATIVMRNYGIKNTANLAGGFMHYNHFLKYSKCKN